MTPVAVTVETTAGRRFVVVFDGLTVDGVKDAIMESFAERGPISVESPEGWQPGHIIVPYDQVHFVAVTDG